MSFESPPTAWPSSHPPVPVRGPVASPPKPAASALTRGLQAIGVGIIAALAMGLAAGLATIFIGVETSCTASGDGWCEVGWLFISIGVAFIAGVISYLVAGCVWVWKHEPAGRRAAPTMLHLFAPVVGVSLLTLVSYVEQLAL